MKLKDRLKILFTGELEEKASRTFPVIYQEVEHRLLDPTKLTTKREYAKTFATDTWVYICVDKIAKAIAGLPLKVYQKTKTGGRIEVDNRISRLLKNPNPYQTRYEFWYTTVLGVELMGNAYWEIVRNAFDLPVEMYTLRPDRMQILPDPKEYIKGYVYKANLKDIKFNADEIIHPKSPHPTDDYYGLSPISAARRSVLLDRYAQEHAEEFFKSGEMPGVVLEYAGSLSDAEWKRLNQRWKAAHGGRKKAHRTAILEGGLKGKSLGMTQQDAQFIKQRKLSREELCAVYDIPPAMVGLLEYANYANVQVQKIIWYTQGIRPRVNMYAEYINKFLIPQFKQYENDNLYAEFLMDEVLKADEETRYKMYDMAIKGGFMLINQARGFENWPSVPWGNRWAMPLNLMFTEEATEGGKTGRKYFVFSKKRMWETLLRNRDRRLKKIRIEFKKNVGIVLKEQANLVIKRMEGEKSLEKPFPNEHSCRLENPDKYERFARKNCAVRSNGKCIDFIFGILEGKSELQSMRYKKDIWTEGAARSHCKEKDGTFEAASKEMTKQYDLTDWLLTYDEELMMYTKNKYLLERSLKAGVMNSIDLVGITIDFDTASSWVIEAIENIGKNFSKGMKKFYKDVEKQLKNELKEGIKEGEGIPELSERVKDVFGNITKSKSEQIARSETAFAYGEGNTEGMKEMKVTHHEWVYGGGPCTYGECPKNDGAVVEIGKAFPSGHKHEPAHPGCTCVTVPFTEI